MAKSTLKSWKVTLERFLAKVDKAKNGCWPWQGAFSGRKMEQGVFWLDGKLERASRVSWRLFHGVIPKGKCVLHDCPSGDNPKCVNPMHLWLGTKAQNSQDMVRKGRSLRGDKNPVAILSAAQAMQIKQTIKAASPLTRPAKSKLYARLARKYRCGKDTISAVVCGHSWKHVTLT